MAQAPGAFYSFGRAVFVSKRRVFGGHVVTYGIKDGGRPPRCLLTETARPKL